MIHFIEQGVLAGSAVSILLLVYQTSLRISGHDPLHRHHDILRRHPGGFADQFGSQHYAGAPGLGIAHSFGQYVISVLKLDVVALPVQLF